MSGEIPAAVLLDLRAEGKLDALRRIVAAMADAGAIRSAEEPLQRVMEREALQSTALGAGIAFPHARTSQAESIRFAAARLAPPLDFDAADGIPVDLVFVILGPLEAPGDHVRLLARLARLAQKRETAADLRGARSEKEFREILAGEL